MLSDLFQIDFMALSGELVVFGALLWLGYIGARIVARFNLPSVTGFLIMGILLGPSVVGFLSDDVLHRLEIVEPVALGVIVFLIGEELTTRMLARHPWQFWMTSVLNIVLPAAFVGLAVAWYSPGEPALAWVLGTIALSGAPATVMAVITERRARGRLCDTMLGCAALDNIVCVLAFAVVVPYLQLVSGLHPSVASALGQTAREVLGAVAIGLVLGWTLARLLKRVTDKSEMLAIAITHVVLAVALADALGVSTLLAPLVAGVVTATFEERQDRARRVFEALRAVEFPVYILFFTIAGANLKLDAVVAGGALVLIYIAARAAGKFAAGFAGGMATGFDVRSSAWVGLGMLPQAGVAVGLALTAGNVFPDVGPTINAVVLAAIVFFEMLGPLFTSRAIEKIATCDVVEEIEADIAGIERATVLVPVSHAFSRERLVFLLHMTSAGRPNARFVLTHLVTHDRPVMRAEALRRGQAILDELAEAGREAGFEVATRLAESQNIGQTLSELAEELGAALVVVGSGQERGVIGRTPLKSRMHRILDEISAPVLIVPERFEPFRRQRANAGPAEEAAPGEPSSDG